MARVAPGDAAPATARRRDVTASLVRAAAAPAVAMNRCFAAGCRGGVRFEGSPRRYVLAACCNGTGHVTQAKAVADCLSELGYECAGVILEAGLSDKLRREVFEPMGAPTLVLAGVQLVDDAGAIGFGKLAYRGAGLTARLPRAARECRDFVRAADAGFLVSCWHYSLALLLLVEESLLMEEDPKAHALGAFRDAARKVGKERVAKTREDDRAAAEAAAAAAARAERDREQRALNDRMEALAAAERLAAARQEALDAAEHELGRKLDDVSKEVILQRVKLEEVAREHDRKRDEERAAALAAEASARAKRRWHWALWKLKMRRFMTKGFSLTRGKVTKQMTLANRLAEVEKKLEQAQWETIKLRSATEQLGVVKEVQKDLAKESREREAQGSKRERNSQLQRLISRPFPTRFG